MMPLPMVNVEAEVPRVEDAITSRLPNDAKEEVALMAPLILRLFVNVEEAVEMSPVVVASPEGPTVNSGTLAEERIWRKFPVCPVAPLRVRRFELVEVEVIVRTVEVA